MRIGQMSLRGTSEKADYLQLDICGLKKEEALSKFEAYRADIPVVLHGDWTKKGCSENNIESRFVDYIEIIQALKTRTNVIGFTIHPPFRKKVPFEVFQSCCQAIENEANTEVWMENRSNSKIWLSVPEEIIENSKQHLMTIDVPQLYISCGYSEEELLNTLNLINWENVRELHLANVKRTEKNTFVARKLHDGDLNIENIVRHIPEVPYVTLEILGGLPTFEREWEVLSQYPEHKKGGRT